MAAANLHRREAWGGARGTAGMGQKAGGRMLRTWHTGGVEGIERVSAQPFPRKGRKQPRRGVQVGNRYGGGALVVQKMVENGIGETLLPDTAG